MSARSLRAAAVAAAAVTLLAGGAAAKDPPVVHPEAARLLVAGPLVGAVGPDRVAIWAMPGPGPGGSPGDGNAAPSLEVAYRVDGAPDGEERRVPMTVEPEPEGIGSAVARLEGLAPATRYRYRVLLNGRADESTTGAFRTAPADGRPFQATIGLASCMHPGRDAEQRAWREMRKSDPALLVQLGDNHYGDSPRRASQVGWHVAQRRVTHYAEFIKVTPTVAIWDDHDYGKNNSDGELRGKEESLSVFRRVFPNPSFGLPDTPGVFFRMSYGDVDLFLLDVRYHRSPNGAPDDAAKTMLGAGQWRWLERELLASKATFKVLCSGSTLIASRADGWSLYTDDRLRLIGLTRTVPGLVFVSGDVHFSTVLTHAAPEGGYSLPEVISSGIGVSASSASYAVLEVDTTAKDPTLTATVVTLDGQGQVLGREPTTFKRSELLPVR